MLEIRIAGLWEDRPSATGTVLHELQTVREELKILEELMEHEERGYMVGAREEPNYKCTRTSPHLSNTPTGGTDQEAVSVLVNCKVRHQTGAARNSPILQLTPTDTYSPKSLATRESRTDQRKRDKMIQWAGRTSRSNQKEGLSKLGETIGRTK